MAETNRTHECLDRLRNCLSSWEDPRIERMRGWMQDLRNDVAFYGKSAPAGPGPAPKDAEGAGDTDAASDTSDTSDTSEESEESNGDRQDEACAGTTPLWQQHADHCLRKAEEASKARDREQLARCCAQAYRFLIHGLPDDEIGLRSDVLRREAPDKLTNWRKHAVEDLLGTPKRPEPDSRNRLALAQYVLDVHFQNIYFKLEVLNARMPWVMYALSAAVVGLLIYAFGLADARDRGFLGDPSQTLLFLFLGAMGAVLSNVATLLTAAGRIPQVIRGWKNFAVRPLLGAVSAAAVLLVLESGLLPIESLTTEAKAAVALLSGFSDQLLNRVMKQAEDKLSK